MVLVDSGAFAFGSGFASGGAPAVCRLPSIVLFLTAVLLAGCQSSELPPCDAPERRAQAHQVAAMSPAVRDSIVGAFMARSRVQQVRLEQQACHFRVTVRVDSFTTHRYASTQGIELIRVLKENAPNETRPVTERTAGEVGLGLYDYTVVYEREGEHETPSPASRKQAAWVQITKPYHDRRVSVSR